MKRTGISLVVLLFLMAGSVTANDSNMDVGVLVGETDGLIGRIYTGENKAFVGAVSRSEGSGVMHFYTDLLNCKPKQWKRATQEGYVYYGIGWKVLLHGESSTGLDLRLPVGLIYPIKATRLDLGVEWVPTVEIFPGNEVQLNRRRLFLPANDIGFAVAISLTYSI